MSVEDNRRYWNSIKDPVYAAALMGHPNRGEPLKKYFGTRLTKEMRILDLGVGAGCFYNLIKDYVNPSKYVGADISSTMLNHCQTTHKGEITLIFLESTYLPFPNDYFDAVICSSVFTHCSLDVIKALSKEIHRVLRGKAYVSIIEGLEDSGKVETYFVFAKGKIQSLLESVGFKILSETEIPGDPQNLLELTK
jgi:ubiquinone/menaquinone biosynthesis C-methylase UbiE